MGENSGKRKHAPGGNGGGGGGKRSRGGNAGRWKTPQHKAKIAEKVELGTTFDVGDAGIWVTFARGMNSKAVREFKAVCEEYAKEMYGSNVLPETEADSKAKGEAEEEDIEESIEAELKSLKESGKPTTRQLFTPVRTPLECVFFMKTMDPVKPGDLVTRMCEDAKNCADPRQRKSKYINRITPIFDTEKATEKGIAKVARSVLAPWFELVDESQDASGQSVAPVSDDPKPPVTYAIRHNVRNHITFKSDEIIKKIAGLVDPRHKVNLGNPDKVILVEVFQLFCGVAVVDGKEWEDLKRYNLNALYSVIPAQQDEPKDAPTS